VASFLCYLFGWVGGLIFLLIEKTNRVVKFNAIQSIALSIALFAVYIVIFILGLIPGIGILFSLLGLLILLGAIALWIYLMVSAFQGKLVRLPVIGDFAAQQAGI
jgi:uncharacterized membrane protein